MNRPTGKRVPCPKCDSKSQFHDGYKNGVYFPVHCHNCGYSPSQEIKAAKAEQAIDKPIGAALCDCGNKLKTANEKKNNVCRVCSGEGLSLEIQGEDYPNDVAIPLADAELCQCGKPLTTKYQVKIKQCFYCQVIGALSVQSDRSALTLGSFSYSKRKGLDVALMVATGATITKLWNKPLLVIPLNDGTTNGYQVIDAKGNKKFAFPLKQNATDNAFFHSFIGDSSGELVACEGYATGISIAMARPDLNILMCSTATNLVKAAKAYGDRIKVIATDNDRKHADEKKNHAGIIKASQAAKLSGAKIWYCPIGDSVSSDFNDLHILQGLDAVKTSFERDIYSAASLHLQAVIHGATYVQTDKPLNEQAINEGITILSAAMGSGKSRLFFPDAKAKGDSCMAVAHLKSLVSGLADVLKLDNYEDSDKASDNIAVCINSIAKHLQAYDVILNDEFHAVLDWLAFGGTGKDYERLKAYKALKQILNSAKYAIFASATMRPEHVQVVMMIAKELNKPVTIIDHTIKPSKKLVIMNYGDFTTKRNEAISSKRNIFSFSLSKDDVIAYEKQLLSQDVKAVAIHSGNSSENMEIITSGDYANYQAILGSPSVLAGVHMVGHFDDVFIDLSAKTEISPLSALQAPGRVRTADTIYTTLQGGKEKLSETAFISPEKILQAKRSSLIKSLRETYELLGYADAEIETKIEAEIARPITDYDLFSVTLKKAHDDEFMAWNSNFLSYADALGYTIEDLRHAKSDDDKAARQARSEGVKEVKTQRYSDIAAINLMDYGNIKDLRDKTDKTELEQYAVTKYDCKETFGLIDSGIEADVKIDAETIKNVLENDLHGLAKNYALLRCEGYASQQLIDDVAAIGEGVKSTANFRNLSAKREVLLALLAVAGVKVATGGYDFTDATWLQADDADKSGINQVIDLIKKHRFTLNFTQYTTLSHKTIVRLLRDWLGFEVETKRIKGGGSLWRVVGLAELVAIGGENVLKRHLAKLEKEKDNLVTFHDSDSFKRNIEIENVTTSYGELNADDVQPVATLSATMSPELKAELHLGCAHHWHWHYHNGAPKCDNCGLMFEQWHSYNQEMLADVIKVAAYAEL